MREYEWICNFRDQCHGSGGFDIEFRDWKCHWKCDYNRIIFTKMFEKHSFKYWKVLPMESTRHMWWCALAVCSAIPLNFHGFTLINWSISKSKVDFQIEICCRQAINAFSQGLIHFTSTFREQLTLTMRFFRTTIYYSLYINGQDASNVLNTFFGLVFREENNNDHY